MLIQLQSKRVVKAQEMADRFGISLRTVYRDVKTLEEAGIPVIGEAGIGYSIMEGYRLPPVMFTQEEATALLTAEKLVEKLTDASTRQVYQAGGPQHPGLARPGRCLPCQRGLAVPAPDQQACGARAGSASGGTNRASASSLPTGVVKKYSCI